MLLFAAQDVPQPPPAHSGNTTFLNGASALDVAIFIAAVAVLIFVLGKTIDVFRTWIQHRQSHL